MCGKTFNKPFSKGRPSLYVLHLNIIPGRPIVEFFADKLLTIIGFYTLGHTLFPNIYSSKPVTSCNNNMNLGMQINY
jgi:hypothetical protein